MPIPIPIPMYTHTYIYIYIFMHTYTYIYIYIFICIHMLRRGAAQRRDPRAVESFLNINDHNYSYYDSY